MVGGTITAFVLKVSQQEQRPVACSNFLFTYRPSTTTTTQRNDTRQVVPGQLSPGDFFVDDSEWEVPAPASHDTVRWLGLTFVHSPMHACMHAWTYTRYHQKQLEKIGLYKRPTYSAQKHYTSINGAAKAAVGGYNTMV
jgi:hypothetical protein